MWVGLQNASHGTKVILWTCDVTKAFLFVTSITKDGAKREIKSCCKEARLTWFGFYGIVI